MTDTTSTPAPTPELKSYVGNCHCGAVKFTVKLPELSTVNECNCSICFRKGYKWAFPGPGCLEFERGEETLKEYEFAGKTIAHMFCPTCGTGVMGKRHAAPPGRNIGLNVRTLYDIDLWSLQVQPFDGKALEPLHKPHTYTGPEPEADIENPKIYNGSCHCGNVTMALKTQNPISGGHEHIQECNCSICAHNGTILTYPQKSQVSIETSTAPLTPYVLGRRFQEHCFCPICGVSICIRKLPVSEAMAQWFKEKQQDSEKWSSKLPVNLKCFQDVEWDDITVKKGNWKDVGGKYVVPA